MRFSQLIVPALGLCKAVLAAPEGPVDLGAISRTDDFIPKRGCGTQQPSDDLRVAYGQLLDAEQTVPLTRRQTQPAPLTIDTWFHIVSSEAKRTYVTDSMIRAQYNVLSNSFKNSTVVFRLRGVTRSVNTTWATAQDDSGMKRTLRRGTYSTLNMYFQTDLQSTQPGAPPGTLLLGFCTLPASIRSSSGSTIPPSAYSGDGCNMIAGSMPFGNINGYNLGYTAVHEVGHWFGLLHTFQDYTCDPSAAGDFITDTPQQSQPSSGCPASQDSCPNLQGNDAVQNYMDYSIDPW